MMTLGHVIMDLEIPINKDGKGNERILIVECDTPLKKTTTAAISGTLKNLPKNDVWEIVVQDEKKAKLLTLNSKNCSSGKIDSKTITLENGSEHDIRATAQKCDPNTSISGKIRVDM